MWDNINRVLLAGTGPIVQEVVDVHFEILQLILLHVRNVVLQLLQCGQLHVRHHAAILVKAPQNAGHQTEHKKEVQSIFRVYSRGKKLALQSYFPKYVIWIQYKKAPPPPSHTHKIKYNVSPMIPPYTLSLHLPDALIWCFAISFDGTTFLLVFGPAGTLASSVTIMSKFALAAPL